MTNPAKANFNCQYRIYWEDTDAGGVVYYANYLKFAERARTEWLRSLGFDQSQLLQNGGAFVVKSCRIDYHHSARLDDLIIVTAAIAEWGAASLVMTQNIILQEQILADLEVKLVFINSAGRPVRIPAAVRAHLS